MEALTRRAILVVDDEPLVAQVLSAMLKILGFNALVAASGIQAEELFRANSGKVVAALLDVRMPVMDGPATMDTLHVLDPELPCVFISGETGPYSWATLIARGGLLVLEKPIRMAKLREALVIATGADNVDAPSVVS